jgi:hypothetical protein
MAAREPSEDWLIHPPPEIPDIHVMNIEQWQAAVERWCQQFEVHPAKEATLSPQEKGLVKGSLQQATESPPRRLVSGA